VTLQRLFTINLFFAVCFGVTCAAVPRGLCAAYGLPLDDAGVWVTRLLGGSILGYATLMWFGRRSPSAEARRAIALALLVQDSVGLLASLAIQLGGRINAVGWSNVAIYGLLACGYAYFVFTGGNPASSAATRAA
jgi:hypothetical protein